MLSGTTTYPVYGIECVNDMSFTEDLTINDVLCDNIGVVDTKQQRNYVEFQFAVKSMFPLLNITQLLSLSAVTQNASEGTEKVGIGTINNQDFYHGWFPNVYDQSTGDMIAVMIHRAKFVEAWTIQMPFGDSWRVEGVRFRAYADTTKPEAQQFGMFIRVDPSVI